MDFSPPECRWSLEAAAWLLIGAAVTMLALWQASRLDDLTSKERFDKDAAVRPTADVQAILTVFGRRSHDEFEKKVHYVMDLRSTDLRGADLHYAQLQRANFSYAQLQVADLRFAHLQGAVLTG